MSSFGVKDLKAMLLGCCSANPPAKNKQGEANRPVQPPQEITSPPQSEKKLLKVESKDPEEKEDQINSAPPVAAFPRPSVGSEPPTSAVPEPVVPVSEEQKPVEENKPAPSQAGFKDEDKEIEPGLEICEEADAELEVGDIDVEITKKKAGTVVHPLGKQYQSGLQPEESPQKRLSVGPNESEIFSFSQQQQHKEYGTMAITNQNPFHPKDSQSDQDQMIFNQKVRRLTEKDQSQRQVSHPAEGSQPPSRSLALGEDQAIQFTQEHEDLEKKKAFMTTIDAKDLKATVHQFQTKPPHKRVTFAEAPIIKEREISVASFDLGLGKKQEQQEEQEEPKEDAPFDFSAYQPRSEFYGEDHTTENGEQDPVTTAAKEQFMTSQTTMTVQQKAAPKVKAKYDPKSGLAPISEEGTGPKSFLSNLGKQQYGTTASRVIYATSKPPMAKTVMEDDSEDLDMTEQLSEEGAFGMEEEAKGGANQYATSMKPIQHGLSRDGQPIKDF